MTQRDVTYRIREARPDELDEVSRLIRASYEEYEPHYLPEVWQRYINNVGNIHDRVADAVLIVAEQDGRIAATVSFYPDGSKSRQGEWPEGWAGILRLAVLPEFRGRGIARALIEECLRQCRERGIATVALHTTAWMAVARSMYERMSFKAAPEFDFHPRPGVTGFGYRYDVDGEQQATSNRQQG